MPDIRSEAFNVQRLLGISKHTIRRSTMNLLPNIDSNSHSERGVLQNAGRQVEEWPSFDSPSTSSGSLSITEMFFATLSLFLALAVALVGCAGQIPPSGGPVDKTPPSIISSSPHQKQLNFNKDRVTLQFDKYMSERSVESAIYFPPFTLNEMDFHWSGKDLRIDLKKPFEADRTYILTIGTTAIDLRNNYLARAYNLVFSTGSLIDTGTVAGTIYSPKKQPYTVAAFNVGENIDTLRPYLDLAKYVTQSDDSGSYILQGLAPGKYRLVCFDDEMHNFLYAPQTDLYASATHDVEISGSAEEISGIDFMPSREDTSRPQLYTAELANDGFVQLKFSDEIDTATVLPSNFTVSDSATKKIYPVVFAARLEENHFSVVLHTDPALPLKRKYFVAAADSVKDTYGNPVSPENKTVTMMTDSAAVRLTPYYFNFSDSLRDVTSYDTLFCQLLSTAGISDSNGASVSLFDSLGNQITGHVERESQCVYGIKLAGLSSREWYGVRIRYPVDSSSGVRDSVVVRHFSTVDSSLLGDIEGAVFPVPKGRRVIVMARNSDGKAFTTFSDSTGKFRLDGIPAGNYDVRAYVRHDSDMSYFSGRSYPYQFAEPFGVFHEPVKVRARWTTEGVDIRLR